MSYANLQIVINTNAAQAAQSMNSFGSEAKQAMSSSREDVERFRQSMVDTASSNALAAQRFQSSMTAANDAVISKTQETKKVMEDVAKASDNVNVKGFSEKMASAFGSAFGAGYAATQTWLEKTEEFVIAKGKAIAIGVAIAAVSSVAAAVYTAYRIATAASDFVVGLFTGSSMKSADIDALIKVNDDVKKLQVELSIASAEANALKYALGRLGVDRKTYVDVYTDAAKAMHTNTEELDRIGVKYKDNNGYLLTQVQFLENVKVKLAEYKEGYDRVAAAEAIGAGSYEKVTETLKVTDQQLERSKSRLDEYHLGIGPGTQAAVERYQQAMRDFNQETSMTADGFSRATADAFMPMATAMSEWLKNGWPVAVDIYRAATGALATTIYGVFGSIGIAFEVFKTAGLSLVMTFVTVKEAIASALTFDWNAYQNSISSGIESIKRMLTSQAKEIADIYGKNKEYVKQAFALDGRDNPFLIEKFDFGAQKSWEPKPKEKPKVADTQERAPFDRYMEELGRMETKLNQNEYAMMRVKAAQDAVRQKGLDLASAMDLANAAIDRIQRTESQRAVDVFTGKLRLENDAYLQQSQLLGLNAAQQEVAAVAIKRRMEAEQAILDAKKTGKALDDQAVADIRANTEAQIDNMQALVQRRQEVMRSADFGQAKAFQEYTDAIGNQATQMKTAWANGFRGMEDAMLSFVKSGKLNFTGLVNSILSDLMRIQIQRSVTGPLSTLLNGALSAFKYSGSSGNVTDANYTNGADMASDAVSSAPRLAVGTPYVPRDMLAYIHEGESITPKGGNTGVNVQIINNTESQVTAQSDGNGGLTVLIDMVKNAMANDVATGTGSLPRAMESRYGLQTSGI